MDNPNITVEVVYAGVSKQHLIAVSVAANSTIETAIRCSGIQQLFPEIDLTEQPVGIFSQRRCLFDKVHAGDRIEIYRALQVDPKEARRAKDKRKRINEAKKNL